MRIREKGALERQYLDVTYIPRDTCGNSDFTVPYDSVGEYSQMQDVVTPNFRSRIAQGDVIVNFMTKSTTERLPPTGASGTYEDAYVYSGKACKTYASWHDGSGVLYAFPDIDREVRHLSVDVDYSSAHIGAATQARAGVLEPEFAGATFVAELGDAIRLFSSPLKAMKDLLGEIKGDQRKAGSKFRKLSLAQFISSHWLWYRYGIMPIVHDMNDASEALTTLEGWAAPRLVSRGQSKLTDTASETQPGGFSPAWSVARDVDTTLTYSVRTGIIYEHAESNTFGFSLQNVPLALWEIVPFSFVVDWFANVSDYVGAISPKVGVKVLGEWTVTKDERETKAEGYSTSRTYDPSLVTYISDPTSTEVYKTEVKTRFPVLAKSGIVWRPTDFIGTVVGQKRILDAFSIVLNMLRA